MRNQGEHRTCQFATSRRGQVGRSSQRWSSGEQGHPSVQLIGVVLYHLSSSVPALRFTTRRRGPTILTRLRQARRHSVASSEYVMIYFWRDRQPHARCWSSPNRGARRLFSFPISFLSLRCPVSIRLPHIRPFFSCHTSLPQGRRDYNRETRDRK